MISAAIVMFAACTKKKPTTSDNTEAVCVKVSSLVETRANVPIQCSGILSSKRMVKLSFKTGGIIAGINVKEGSVVRKGQVLASLDMTEIASQVSQARLAFEKAERDLDRVKNLYKDTVATLEQLQDATSAYEVASENKNIAEFNLRYSSIIAPANGRIIAKLSEEDELVSPGTPVLVFTENGDDEWVVKAGISDKDIIRVKNGDQAEVELDAFPGRTFPAYISQVSEAADPASGTFEIEVTVKPCTERFVNGLVAKVQVESINAQVITLVPPDALTEADGRKGYVYVVKPADTTARRVPVTIAYLENNNVAIIESVNKLGQVIVKGASYLEDGTKVNIVR
jgi:RND family efflux transporter MFP subunit